VTTQRRVAWITGGGRNIGRGICFALAAGGLDVVTIGHTRPEEVAAVADEIRARGVDALALTADMGDREAVAGAAAAALERFGRVDVLVNNAALRTHSQFLQLEEEELMTNLSVNVGGVYRWCKAALPSMVERGSGSIINISGTAIYTGRLGGAASISSRAGVLGMTRVLAIELGPLGVRVNMVVLGRIDTIRAVPSPAGELEAELAQTPLRRMGRPDEVGAVCAFLASDESSYITGQVIHANGGSLLAS
jgi:NAD(P)-dependent dehydrogenase (short-subunit alcohol dehydrogenase family)